MHWKSRDLFWKKCIQQLFCPVSLELASFGRQIQNLPSLPSILWAVGLAHPLGAHLGDRRRRYFRIKTNKRICKIIFRFPFHWDQSLQSSFQKICACGYRMAATQKNPWVRARHDRKQKQWRRYEINFRETVQKVAWLRIDTILSIWNIKAKYRQKEK